MKIVHITSELAPFAKAGGLGDAVYGLCKQLAVQGHDVEVIMPAYGFIDKNFLESAREIEAPFPTLEGGEHHLNRVFTLDFAGFRLHLIKTNHPLRYFDRESIYGYSDDPERFAYFSMAATELIARQKREIDVLHLHDWPTALAAYACKAIHQPLGLELKGILLNLHNAQHRGCCRAKTLQNLGIHTFEELEEGEKIFLLKAGTVYSNMLVAVSPENRRELLSDPLIKPHQKKLHGVLNGIDTDMWHPDSDPLLPCKGKRQNREALLSDLDIPDEEAAPLFVMISRLAPQKGPELMAAAAIHILENGGKVLILGDGAHEKHKQLFIDLKAELCASNSGALIEEFNEQLAHRMYAAADFIVIPSIYEPCGLTQMIAMRYGAVPIVRRTGGLADSVIDFEHGVSSAHNPNGIVFKPATKEGVTSAIDRAFKLYENEMRFQSIIANGSKCNFSWARPVQEYELIYQMIISEHSLK